jgi:hypothetical protein
MVKKFTNAFTSDDIETYMTFFVPASERQLVATGEIFRALNQIKQLAERSVAAR